MLLNAPGDCARSRPLARFLARMLSLLPLGGRRLAQAVRSICWPACCWG